MKLIKIIILKTVVKHNARFDNNQCIQMKCLFYLIYSKINDGTLQRLLNFIIINNIGTILKPIFTRNAMIILK